MKKLLKEFKAFINKGSVMDLAVGMIIGSAFTAIVTALVQNILTPLINWIPGTSETGALQTVLREAVTDDAGNVVTEALILDWGAVISAIVTFLCTAIVLFLIVKAFNKIKESGEKVKEAAAKKINSENSEQPTEQVEAAAAPAPAPEPSQTEILLKEILEVLKTKENGSETNCLAQKHARRDRWRGLFFDSYILPIRSAAGRGAKTAQDLFCDIFVFLFDKSVDISVFVARYPCDKLFAARASEYEIKHVDPVVVLQGYGKHAPYRFGIGVFGIGRYQRIVPAALFQSHPKRICGIIVILDISVVGKIFVEVFLFVGAVLLPESGQNLFQFRLGFVRATVCGKLVGRVFDAQYFVQLAFEILILHLSSPFCAPSVSSQTMNMSVSL